MRKWICCIIILALAACCACAFAEDVPTLAFEETERVNYKPVVAGNPPGFEVDTWLQKMVVKNEDYFWSVDPDGPKFTYPFLPLSSLKNGVFDQACQSEDIQQYDLVVIGHCHQNFVKGNVVSVSATGLEGASYLLIEADQNGVSFQHFNIRQS